VTVLCLTCDYIVIGAARRTVGCLCDPDAPTWVAIDDDARVIGGTYRKTQTLITETGRR